MFYRWQVGKHLLKNFDAEKWGYYIETQKATTECICMSVK